MTQTTFSLSATISALFKAVKKKVFGEKTLEQIIGGIEAFEQNTPYPQDYTTQLITRFKKQQTPQSTAEKYSVHREKGKGKSKKTTLYYDGSYTFVLWNHTLFTDKPVAQISFDVYDNILTVQQIQGVKGMQHKLQPIKWERALLTLVTEWAKVQKIPEVRVSSYKHNTWFQVYNSDIACNNVSYDLQLTDIIKQERPIAQFRLVNYSRREGEPDFKTTDIRGCQEGEEETFVFDNKLYTVKVVSISPNNNSAKFAINNRQTGDATLTHKLIYDINARKSGFVYDAKKKLYVKRIL